MAIVTVVLIHGFPETSAIWSPLSERLTSSEVVTLQLPGFGCAAPSGWTATKEDYLAWLSEELAALSLHGRLDVVGHDWGGGLLVAAVAARPDLVRSWVCDILGVFHPDYQWHDFARFMQLPDANEEMVVNVLTGELFMSLGFPGDVAAQVVASIDDQYARCALALYRSAAQPAMVEWGRDISTAGSRPGLVLKAELDSYAGTLEQVEAMSDRIGATTRLVPDQGHWWMLSDPEGSAAILEEFWATLA
jgi:pimeloyl-ACP methyl ester carboxylesterase